MPHQLAYVSTASTTMRRDDLIKLLERAREVNRKNAVTGLLLYHGGNFVQILEGDRDVVKQLFGHIAHDPRHHKVCVLFEHQTDTAEYEDWSMGFQALDGSEWMEFPNMENNPTDLRGAVEHYGRAKELLTLMRVRGLDPKKEIATRQA